MTRNPSQFSGRRSRTSTVSVPPSISQQASPFSSQESATSAVPETPIPYSGTSQFTASQASRSSSQVSGNLSASEPPRQKTDHAHLLEMLPQMRRQYHGNGLWNCKCSDKQNPMDQLWPHARKAGGSYFKCAKHFQEGCDFSLESTGKEWYEEKFNAEILDGTFFKQVNGVAAPNRKRFITNESRVLLDPSFHMSVGDDDTLRTPKRVKGAAVSAAEELREPGIDIGETRVPFPAQLGASPASASKKSGRKNATGGGGKYYAVRNGPRPGIYRTWELAKVNIEGVSGIEQSSFKTEDQARAYLAERAVLPRGSATSSVHSQLAKTFLEEAVKAVSTLAAQDLSNSVLDTLKEGDIVVSQEQREALSATTLKHTEAFEKVKKGFEEAKSSLRVKEEQVLELEHQAEKLKESLAKSERLVVELWEQTLAMDRPSVD
ncbi:uncharacterized protein K460DRAFT_418212 [Cucurbitaria berberidis CBS 394.84]|uniref:Ribonuclease H1 N-terminal domain-containing protein n=1 Tax=Cucurbitaria berberidis CBS 394.84 TaxID=1168544 RepID=A0A9P4GC05_9PLEO|nr:uncharacterized protein K460DRAFT_418212 [Cucurbitaria berberidis CBS 394.84]KAF1843078.1 hypothetical protein K460DRAFT_418212 [Cucurbitaria berberidis CBS 394.84]